MTLTTASPAQDPDDDPWMWLEEVQDAKALDWVRERNAQTRQRLQAWLGFDATRERILQVLDSRDRIPVIARRGDFVYNFWQDSDNPRGLWRRTTLDEYRLSAPAWELLLDVDALGRSEGENWVWAGAVCLGPDYTRCLVKLSRGGADAQVVREFDTATRQFVAGGFNLPEAKSEVAWLDRDTVFVGTDFGPGSLTDSGYPRLIKRWQRGQPLADAVTVFEAQHSDVAASVHVDATPGFERTLLQRAPDFFSSEEFLLVDGQLRRLDKPADAQLGFWYGQVLLALRSDWQQGGTTWPRGALLASDAMAFLNGKAQWTALFTPTATRSLAGYALLRHTVLLELLDNVAGRLQEQRFDGSHWNAREVEAPFPGTLHAQSLHDTQVPDDPLGENYLLTYTDFLTPESLLLGRTGSDPRDLLKARPAFFDATGMRVEQRFATSRDGTRVPYFVVWPKGATPDGNNPTLLYGYGGFEVPLAAPVFRRLRQRLVRPRRRTGGGQHPRRRRVRSRLAPGGAEGPAAEGLRRLHRRGRGPGGRGHHPAAAARHPGRQQRRVAGRRGDAAAARAVPRRGLPGAAAGHAPLPPAAGRRQLDGRVR